MALRQEQLMEFAVRVDEAARLGQTITKLSDEVEELTLEEAYTIQRLSMSLRTGRGERIVGMKMGLTSKAKMDQVGVKQPIYGHLTSAMQRSSGGVLRMSEQIHPRVEPEIAFLLGSDLRGPVSIPQAMEAISSVFLAIEVIDSRYEKFQFTLPDVVADNASSTRFFLGEKAFDINELSVDLGNVGMVMEIDGEVRQVGSSAAIYDHPLRALVALSELLSERDEHLAAGSIVLAGAATAAEFVAPGQHVVLRGDGLGEVHLDVVA